MNAVTEELKAIDLQDAAPQTISRLKREQIDLLNATLLHELYFASLGGDGRTLPESITSAITRDFGSVDHWRQEFIALAEALAGDAGWILLSYVPRDGRLINVNRPAIQLLGRTAAELMGSPVLDLCGGTAAGRTRAEEAFRRCFAGSEVSGLELEMNRRDGRPLWISLWMRPIRGVSGTIEAAHSIWIDVTDRVLAEAERARLQQQNLYLQEEIKAVHNFEEIIGRSPALLAVLDQVSRVAATDEAT